MFRLMKIAALAGCALALSAVPGLAQNLALPGLDLDLDPFHIFTPAPPPPAVPVVAHHHHHHRHHWHHHHWHHGPRHAAER